MRERLLAIMLCAGVAPATVAAADEPGWFLEQPSAFANAELGIDLLAPRFDVWEHPLLTLSAGYRFNESFSLRARVYEVATDTNHGQRCTDTDFVCSSAGQLALDYVAGYSLSLMPAFLLHDDLAVYGHLGVQGWNVEANGDPNVKKSDLLFGIGVGYDVSNPLRLQLEYRSMDLDIKLTSVGFSWRF